MTPSLKTLLSGSPELRPLLDKARGLTVLQHHFNSIAPQHLTQSSQVLGLQNGTLNIAVANATIAAKLRQHAPELVVLLRNSGWEVNGIRVKVQVSYETSRPKPAPRKLGKAAKKALEELGSGMHDSPLKHALNKLTRKD